MPCKIKDKNTISMNMKYYGRNIEKFMCKKCLMKSLELTRQEWDEKINEFKQQGCTLF
jgi:biotin operon repressor